MGQVNPVYYKVVAHVLTYCVLVAATLRIFPGISGSAVRAFLQADDVKGVVLESFGAGNAPRKEALLSAFREATDRGVVCVQHLTSEPGEVS